MRPRDLADLLMLTALWGGSFLFMRISAGEFGLLALGEVRMVGASAFLLPRLAMRGGLADLCRHWPARLLVGLTKSARPFLCFGYAPLPRCPSAPACRPPSMPPRRCSARSSPGPGWATSVAYILFFRLIAHVGAARTITVTFLIPVFAVLWGALFLHESLTTVMVLGCAVILLGTELTTGALKMKMRPA